jgi:hypothetical protein
VHAYEVYRRQPSFQPIPSARSAPEFAGGSSATPIYDALCAEWGKSFRTLPGDRSGEEDLGFTAFGNMPRAEGSYGGHLPGSFSSSYSAYSAGAYSARQRSQGQRVGYIGHQNTGQQGTGMHHVPAALPPGRGGI